MGRTNGMRRAFAAAAVALGLIAATVTSSPAVAVEPPLPRVMESNGGLPLSWPAGLSGTHFRVLSDASSFASEDSPTACHASAGIGPDNADDAGPVKKTKFRLWYKAKAVGAAPYLLRMASSANGVTWIDEGAVCWEGNPRPTQTANSGGAPVLSDNRSGPLAIVYNPLGLQGSSGTYRMWFQAANPTCAAAIDAEIPYLQTAWSTNGMDWFQRQGVRQDAAARLVTGIAGEENCATYGPVDVLYLPDGSGPGGADFPYTMYYTVVSQVPNGNHGIYVAVSSDGQTWRKHGAGRALFGSGSGWDGSHASFGSVLKSGGEFKLFYSGGSGGPWEGVGYAVSSDGVAFTRASTPLISRTGWRSGFAFQPSVTVLDGAPHYFIAGGAPFAGATPWDDLAKFRMGLFTSPTAPSPPFGTLVGDADGWINVAEADPMRVTWTIPITVDAVRVEVFEDGGLPGPDCVFTSTVRTGDSVPAACLDGISDGPIGVSLIAVAPEGESRPFVLQATLDRQAEPPAVRIVSDANRDGVLSDEEIGGGLTVAGDGEAGSTVTIHLVQPGSSVSPKTALVGDEGSWTTTFPVLDVSSLSAGPFQVSASQIDPAGNTGCCGTVSAEIQRSLLAPKIEFLGAEEDGIVSGLDTEKSTVKVRVTYPGALPTATVSLTLRDGSDPPSEVVGSNFDEPEPREAVELAPGESTEFVVDATPLRDGVVTAVALATSGTSSRTGQSSTTVDYGPPETSVTETVCDDGVCYSAPPVLWAAGVLLPPEQAGTVMFFQGSKLRLRGLTEDAASPLAFVVVEARNTSSQEIEYFAAQRIERIGSSSPWRLTIDIGNGQLGPGTWELSARGMDQGGNFERPSARNTKTVTVTGVV